MTSRALTTAIILLIAISSTFSQTLAPTPPMGWNSWNCFQEKINEEQIREIADIMVSSGMRDAGYEYLVLDDGWMAAERDENGRLQADPEKFPSGMKAIGDYIHSKGLKYGIYECRGYLTCQRLPGSFEHEEDDMASFAEWGVDYIKLDACYAEKNGRLTTEDLQIYKDAIEKTGRPMLLSISDFGNGGWVWGGKDYGQLWRTGYDIYPWIENVYHHAESSGGDLRIHPAFNGLWQFAGPGYWNDPDMLQIGNLKSEEEDKVHMSLWCMLAAPLMAGNDLRTMSDTINNVLIAPEVIAVNQDSRGHQGYKVYDNGKQQIYNKPLSDGTTAVLLFNKDSVPANVSVSWSQIGLSGKQKVRDLWARENLGSYKDGFTAWLLPQHGQYLLKVGKVGSELVAGPQPVAKEKYTAKEKGFSYLSDLYYIMKYGQAPVYDKSTAGKPIKLSGEEYDKGLSCVNGSILLYKLSGNSNRFRANVGLEDEYSGIGTGRFKVLNEDAFGGKVLFDSGLMTRDSAAKQIDIDVKGLDCLFLKFEGKEEATGNWANARLVGSWDGHKVSYNDKYIDSLISKMDLIPLRINGDKDNRINIVIINRWEKKDEAPYNDPAMKEEFLKDINKSLVAAFTPGDPAAQTAYANYQQFFNLYALWWPDTPEWKNGVDSELIDAVRDRLFLPWKDEHTGWVTFLLMPNRDGGGGGAARNLEARIGSAVIVGNGIGKMLHEISHTCTSIGDEYTAGATGTSASPTYTASLEYQRHDIKWRAWIDPDTPMPTPYTRDNIDKVGAFEGCQYHLTKYFRPSAQGCIMGAGVFDNTEEMCAICEQRLSMRMYTLVFPIEQTFPSDNELYLKGPAKQHFSVKRVHPEPDTQVTQWILNGEVIASGVDEIDISFDANKEYELVFTLRDITDFIREDPPFGEYPYREYRWKITTKNPDDISQANSGVDQSEVYDFIWTESNPNFPEGKRYEAENAEFSSKDSEICSYFGASEQSILKVNGANNITTWTIEVDKDGWYSLELIYASAQHGKTYLDVSVNGQLVNEGLNFPESRPLYTGWDDINVKALLHSGENEISLKTKDVTQINLDYLWVPSETIPEPEMIEKAESFVLGNTSLNRTKSGIEIKNPDNTLDYLWYTEDIPVYIQEDVQVPISIGNDFNPETKGNFYLGARNMISGIESSNRIGFYYDSMPLKKSKTISPDKVKSANLLLWLDANDMDGNFEADLPIPPRDPYKNWKDKAQGMNGPFVLYKPNQLNGMGTAGFEIVWVTRLERAVSNFQTVIMIYKESNMSFPGTTPFRALDKLIDLQTDADFSEYVMLTKEFDSKVEAELKTSQGYWEGSLAEMLIYDGILSDKERKAVEAGLKEKWFSLNK